MNGGTKFGWKRAGRMLLCLALLIWIFHAIFLQEGSRNYAAGGHSWNALSRTAQARIAWTQGPAELWSTFRQVRADMFILSWLFMGLTLLLGMIRWRMFLLVQGLDLSFGRTAEISLVAHFFNSFLLGSTGGDVLKAYYAARETHHKKTEAVMTVLVDRVLGLLAMLLFACLMMLPNWNLIRSHATLTSLAWVIIAMFAGAAGVVALSFWGGVSRAWPSARPWLRKLPKGDLLDRALSATREFGKKRWFLMEVFSISMALNLVCVLQILALCWGLDIQIPVVALLVVVPVVVCLSALPITPSGLGVRENLYVLMLTVPELNVDPTKALTLSLLAYAGSLLWSLIGGAVYLTRKERDHLAEIKTERQLEDT